MSDDQAINVVKTPNPADRITNKPVYLVSVEYPQNTKKTIRYYKTSDVVKNGYGIVIRGNELTEKQANTVRENINATDVGKEINHEIPWQKVISIENVSYKIAQTKENQNVK